MEKKKVLLAMSGGIDSSAAILLLRDKFDIVGVTLRLCDKVEGEMPPDIKCAQEVALSNDMPHHIFDYRDLFKEKVIGNFVKSYDNGETPNPCIFCNENIKFGKLLTEMEELGCDYISTGHYIRVEKDEKSGRFLLKKGRDLSKDQSYVLYCLSQEVLSKAVFPMGDILKEDARGLAKEAKLINYDKPDSQDICFIPDGDYVGYIERYKGEKGKIGDFLDTKGRVLGKHKGITNYTIGQRKGIGIAFGKPVYVVEINAQNNTVTLGDECDLYKNECTARDVNLISIEKLTAPMKAKAKTRYKQVEEPCTLFPNDDGTIKVVFDKPLKAITKGQSVVFYDGDYVIGGGIIC